MALTPFEPLKLLRHADVVERSLRGEPVWPISVEIDLSTRCDHQCPWCSFGTTESQGYRQQTWTHLPTERALTVLEELAQRGTKSITFTGGGEPLVHRAAGAIFERTSDLGLQWGLVTNGSQLRGQVVDIIGDRAVFVRVSLDAGSAETHMLTHGLSRPQYHQILANMTHLRERARPWLTLGAGFCVQSSNWREIFAAARDVKEAGANYLEVRPVFPTEWRGDGFGRSLSDEEVELAQVEIRHAQAHLNDAYFKVIGMVERFDALVSHDKGYEKCRIGPLMTVIGAEGSVWHCCVQRGMSGFKVGDILEQPLASIWQTPAHQQMLAQIDVSKCPRCRYDSYNRTIERAFLRDEMHKDFL